MNQTVFIGRDPEAPFVAFGDDSKFGDVLAFAFVVIKRCDIDRMQKRLLKVKRRLGVPESYVLHCRELFHPHPREKAGLGHITDQQARSIVGHLIHELNVLDCWVRYAFFRKIEGQVMFQPDDQIPAVESDKGMLAMLAQASILPMVQGVGGPDAHRCEIHVAEDPTQVSFFGDGRSRADRWASGYSDVGAPPGSVFRLQPHLVTATSNPMMQIADVVSYTCSHALSEAPRAPFFREQFSRVRRFTRTEFQSDEKSTPKEAFSGVVNRISTAMKMRSSSSGGA